MRQQIWGTAILSGLKCGGAVSGSGWASPTLLCPSSGHAQLVSEAAEGVEVMYIGRGRAIASRTARKGYVALAIYGHQHCQHDPWKNGLQYLACKVYGGLYSSCLAGTIKSLLCNLFSFLRFPDLFVRCFPRVHSSFCNNL
jgi:hypothetical protein